MGHLALQRAVVRLIHDPKLVERLAEDPEGALRGMDLSEEEKGWLLAVDPRAFGTDGLRARRALRTLAEEFKGATTVALAETRSLASLEQYFSSPEFHRAVEERGSLALSFGAYLLRLGEEGRVQAPCFPDLVRLEATMARCRRDLARAEEEAGATPPGPPRPPRPYKLHWRLAPGVAVGSFRGDVVPALNAVEGYLFEVGLMPAVALCDDAPRMPALPAWDGSLTRLMFVPLSRGVSLVELDEEALAVLELLEQPRRPAALFAAAGARGVAEKRAKALVEGWIEGEVVEAVEG